MQTRGWADDAAGWAAYSRSPWNELRSTIRVKVKAAAGGSFGREAGLTAVRNFAAVWRRGSPPNAPAAKRGPRWRTTTGAIGTFVWTHGLKQLRRDLSGSAGLAEIGAVEDCAGRLAQEQHQRAQSLAERAVAHGPAAVCGRAGKRSAAELRLGNASGRAADEFSRDVAGREQRPEEIAASTDALRR